MCGEIRERKCYNDAWKRAPPPSYRNREFFEESKRSGSTAKQQRAPRFSETRAYVSRGLTQTFLSRRIAWSPYECASVLPRQTINIKERPLFCQFALSCSMWPVQTLCVERRTYFIAFEITQIVHSNLFPGRILTYSARAHACLFWKLR